MTWTKEESFGQDSMVKLLMKLLFLIGPPPSFDALIGRLLSSLSSVETMTLTYFASAALKHFHVNRRPIGSNFYAVFQFYWHRMNLRRVQIEVIVLFSGR